jgi:hypothetical protein
MEMRVFGRTGMELSVLGFGCGAVGGVMVRGDPRDQERTIARAIAAGVNYFDTAVQYGNGESEKNLGRILQKLKPPDVAVGTDAFASVLQAVALERVMPEWAFSESYLAQTLPLHRMPLSSTEQPRPRLVAPYQHCPRTPERTLRPTKPRAQQERPRFQHRLWLRNFVIKDAKRLLQQNRSKAVFAESLEGTKNARSTNGSDAADTCCPTRDPVCGAA